MLKKQQSIKHVNSDAMTSKERQTFFNSKVAQFEDALEEIEEHLKNMQVVSQSPCQFNISIIHF